ncbi:glycoside hydrolase family 57 protein [Thermithiobacillus plumbiphilus]|uniref:Glycoside hydrolase family 57 protein n=1 Tax=Thermithiobacillus plumbiphilus TaxID=1729899 RepID=A0ABU9D4G3_9PROT
MSPERKLKVVFCWHMHQPEYRQMSSGDFALPWTYLHALKDYTDMAWHLEQVPGARAVVNFVPILLDQLADYCQQFENGNFRDPLLRALALPDLGTLGQDDRRQLLSSCFRANQEHLIDPFPGYRHLQQLYQHTVESDADSLEYLSVQYFADLVTWYHLAWTGETVRRSHPEIISLMAKGHGFTPADRQQLIHIYGQVFADLIPRYRRLADSGKIELSTTPYFHPILPLLQDLKVAAESLDAPLPAREAYPGGIERARWHLEAAKQSHRELFGHEVTGMWPAEGGVSDATLHLMAHEGLQWAATGEGVLANSLRRQIEGELPDRVEYLYQPYRVSDGRAGICCFFRDDRLSDLIGFEYSRWFGRDAVDHFVHELEKIRELSADQPDPVVSIILDGENAWEYYPYNGFYFLSGLYQRLAEHPGIEMSTYRDYLVNSQAPCPASLDKVVAGSWVYGTFSTWIGSPDKNRAWELLCDAKSAFDAVIARGELNPAQLTPALHQLAICEGSDWFWWFGDYNPDDTVRDFDALYRANLANLYRLIKLPVPRVLEDTISVGAGHPASGGVMRPGQVH